MSFVDREALSNGTSSMGLEKMAIPSILLHLVVIGLVIVAPIFPIKRVSYPSVYMVSLVSSSRGTPLEVTERRITKEAGKTKPVGKIKSKPIRKIPRETPVKSIRKKVVKEKAFSRKVSTEKMISAAVERIKEEESSKKISEAISRVRE
ncbi:MAG: hypothetical protein ABID54_03640, partial [Pseudomonadota bacterium]